MPLTDQQLRAIWDDPQTTDDDLALLAPEEQQRLVELTATSPVEEIQARAAHPLAGMMEAVGAPLRAVQGALDPRTTAEAKVMAGSSQPTFGQEFVTNPMAEWAERPGGGMGKAALKGLLQGTLGPLSIPGVAGMAADLPFDPLAWAGMGLGALKRPASRIGRDIGPALRAWWKGGQEALGPMSPRFPGTKAPTLNAALEDALTQVQQAPPLSTRTTLPTRLPPFPGTAEPLETVARAVEQGRPLPPRGQALARQLQPTPPPEVAPPTSRIPTIEEALTAALEDARQAPLAADVRGVGLPTQLQPVATADELETVARMLAQGRPLTPRGVEIARKAGLIGGPEPTMGPSIPKMGPVGPPRPPPSPPPIPPEPGVAPGAVALERALAKHKQGLLPTKHVTWPSEPPPSSVAMQRAINPDAIEIIPGVLRTKEELIALQQEHGAVKAARLLGASGTETKEVAEKIRQLTGTRGRLPDAARRDIARTADRMTEGKAKGMLPATREGWMGEKGSVVNPFGGMRRQDLARLFLVDPLLGFGSALRAGVGGTGGLGLGAVERLLQGRPGDAARMLANLALIPPRAVKAFAHPGSVVRRTAETASKLGPTGMRPIPRTIGALDEGIQAAIQAGRFSPAESARMTLSGMPETEAGEATLEYLKRMRPWSYLPEPFPRVAVIGVEQSLKRLPFVDVLAKLAGHPVPKGFTSGPKQVTGALAGLAGYEYQKRRPKQPEERTFKVGPLKVSTDPTINALFGPALIEGVIGRAIAKALEPPAVQGRGRGGRPTPDVGKRFSVALAKMLGFELPLITTESDFRNITNLLTRPQERVIPKWLAEVAEMTDPYERDPAAAGYWGGTKMKIPGLRQTLPVKRPAGRGRR